MSKASAYKLFCLISILFIILMNNCTLYAQTEVEEEENDFVLDTISDEKKHSAGAASLMSMAVPGLGQAYNKSIWKVPIVYGGFFSFFYAFNFYGEKYNEYREAYIFRTDTDILTRDNFENRLSIDNLKRSMDFNRKWRDFSVIMIFIWYTINIVDASVDANLYDYDISSDLTFNVKPSLFNNPVPNFPNNSNPGIGVSFSYNF